MKKFSYLIVLALILGLVLTGCSLLSDISQIPATGQGGITYLTKEISYPDLVALWHFNGDAKDSSGYDNDGFAPSTSYETSLMGQAMNFNGSDYVMVSDSDTLEITNGITIEAWINPTAVDDYRTIVAKRSGSVANYVLRLWNGKVEFYYRKAGASYWSEWCTTSVPVIAGNAYRIAVTYTFGDDDSIKVNVNDMLYGGSWLHGVPEEVTGNTYPVYIGCISPSSQPFIGLIDEVRIWNFALSQDQLGKVYEFEGFFRPIDSDVDVFNVVKAGRAIPVKFSLKGDQGLDIFVPGYPKLVNIIDCDSPDPSAIPIEETVTAGGSNLSYDATEGQYTYVWKTEKYWTGCRQLIVKLIDGTYQSAKFTFK